eukprot:1804296-Rhodomonas_salina.1
MKTDDHMLKIRKQLLAQAAKVEAAEMKRKQLDAKKYGKALQVERQVEKDKRKKQDMETIGKWRKGKVTESEKRKEEELLQLATGKPVKKKGLNDFIEERTGRRPDAPTKSAKRLAYDKK